MGRVSDVWRNIVIGSVLAGLFGGCAAQSLEGDQIPAQVRDDSFNPAQEIDTAVIETGRFPGDVVLISLKARRDRKTRAVSTHARIGVLYAARLTRRYESARSASAVALPLRHLQNDGTGCTRRSGCLHSVMLEIDIPESDLRAAHTARAGFAIKLFARAGHETLASIPWELIEALFRGLGEPRPVAAAPRAGVRP